MELIASPGDAYETLSDEAIAFFMHLVHLRFKTYMKKPLSIQILLIIVYIYLSSIALWTIPAQIQIYRMFASKDYFVRNLLTSVPLQLLVILSPSILILFAIQRRSRKLKQIFLVVQMLQFIAYMPFFILFILYEGSNIKETQTLYYNLKAYQRSITAFFSFCLPGIIYTIVILRSQSRDYFMISGGQGGTRVTS